VSKRIGIVSLAFERGELLGRERIEEGVRHLELAPVGPEASLRSRGRDCGQARNRRPAAHDDDFLARGCPRDQSGKVGLGDMDGDGRHSILLA
jgi:hypothetical protein